MIDKKKNFILDYKEDILTVFLALLCLVLLVIFPTSGASQNITSGVVFLAVLPLLYLKFVLKKNLSDFGWQWGDWKAGLLFSAFYLIGGLLIFYALFHYTSFASGYQLPGPIFTSFWYFVFYELLIVGVFTALYEIFFRGFFMFSLAEKTGIYSIFYQFLLFFLFFWVTGNLNWNNAPFLAAAFFSGLASFKSRSLLYSFATSLLFMIILDALVIKFSH